MDKYTDAVISVIKAGNLDPDDHDKVVKSLMECVSGRKLVDIYKSNTSKFNDLTYSYQLGR